MNRLFVVLLVAFVLSCGKEDKHSPDPLPRLKEIAEDSTAVRGVLLGLFPIDSPSYKVIAQYLATIDTTFEFYDVSRYPKEKAMKISTRRTNPKTLEREFDYPEPTPFEMTALQEAMALEQVVEMHFIHQETIRMMNLIFESGRAYKDYDFSLFYSSGAEFGRTDWLKFRDHFRNRNSRQPFRWDFPLNNHWLIKSIPFDVQLDSMGDPYEWD